MKKMEGRLLGLVAGELIALILFLYICLLLDLGLATFVAVVYLAFILLQGSLYWLYRYRLLRKDRMPGDTAVKVLAALRASNPLVIVLTVACALVLNRDALDLTVSVGVLVFGLIEYINYYWCRLSYGRSGFNIRLLLATGFKGSSISKLISSKKDSRPTAR